MGQISVSYFEARGFDARGPAVIVPKRHGDTRGYFCETWNQTDWLGAGLPDLRWMQDNEARSAKAGTLRGLHFQAPPSAQAKLVRAVHGDIYDVAVDIRKGAPTYGQYVGVTLSSERGDQLLVPAGFAHGYQTLTPDVLVSYKCDAAYDPDTESGLIWSDEDIGIDWPLATPHLSEKDKTLPHLSDLASPFKYTL
ncbi:MAG: dTDP-4-dehydrorhamnose 3,5-epimerase [Hyphomonadaceae bacterium]